ncbi:MAG: hypothetical protein KGI00_03315 [Candidatus Micrarchaeota archaeon]|nr:hypothetical protein [Candidatus Micrarchaeota archaeon]MDE1849734.1 hypothetical protein [Candidatus Micrarchaeota archaeon]
MTEETTTIQVTKRDSRRLERLKLHPAQPIKEVVQMLLDDKEFDDISTTIVRERWKMVVELSDLRGRRKEDALKAGFA